MKTNNQITILTKFYPYLRLIQAYRPENFRQNGSWCCTVQSAVAIFGATIMIGSMSIGAILMAWNLVENGDDVKVLVVSSPILLSLILVDLSFLALVWKHDTITEVIERIQELIGQRKHFFCPCSFCL